MSPLAAVPAKTYFSFARDKGLFSQTTTRCAGVGACRKVDHGTLCPSYMATREENHSTRGRAHLLLEVFQGSIVTEGWKSIQIKHALALCLSGKACKMECPVSVDRAAWKAEFLTQHYEGNRRPLGTRSGGPFGEEFY